jgi:3,4-dihydroxy-2-butanone 4-phosphate synthase
MLHQDEQDLIDEFWMQKAVEESEKGKYTCSPNPHVGAIVVSDKNVYLDSGHHIRPGGNHAERNVVLSEGNTLYVTLEPCSHHGRTPPCIDYIIENKPRRVVIGVLDPDPRVSGRGLQALMDAGIETKLGVLESKIKYSLRAYLWHRTHGNTPYVVAKLALSQDNCYKYTVETDWRRWITGEEARTHAHGIRASSQRVVVGKNTWKIDVPKLTVRYGIIVDKQPEAVVSTRDLGWLHEQSEDVVQILVEGGPELHDDLLSKHLIQEFVIYRSTNILGLKGVHWSPSFSSEWKLVETQTFSNGDTMSRLLCHTNDKEEIKTEVSLDSIQDVIKALQRGEMVVVLDDKSRENEGDLMGLADIFTEDSMKTMLSLTTGIVCAAMTQARATQLQLPPMTAKDCNTDPHGTNFTISVDSAKDTTTGVSSKDRTKTVVDLASIYTLPTDLSRPGHIFPLVASAGGLSERRGHTEAGVCLAILAGAIDYPVMVISELYDRSTGKMMSRRQCLELGFLTTSVSDIVSHLNKFPKSL